MARRALAEVPPGLRPARREAPRRRGEGPRPGVQPVRRPPPQRRSRSRTSSRSPASRSRRSEAGLDLLVVDEAHRLERSPRDAGSARSRADRPARRRHLLLLSATPLEADTSRLLPPARAGPPRRLPLREGVPRRARGGQPLPPCTSATRRVDIGGLPPRVPAAGRAGPRPRPPQALTGDEKARTPSTRASSGWSPRRRASPAEASEEGKTLVFCHDLPTLAGAQGAPGARRRGSASRSSTRSCRPTGATSRWPSSAGPTGPTFLVATECGGEGRNFEFCRRLVLFDLPLDPAQVEQRIGRLDRISRTATGRDRLLPPAVRASTPSSSRLYEAIGLFREPLGGLERSLAHVEAAIRKAETASAAGAAELPVRRSSPEVRERGAGRARGQSTTTSTPRAIRPDLAAGILARVPRGPRRGDGAVRPGGVRALRLRDRRATQGAHAGTSSSAETRILEHLPGVPGGFRFLGTFDREEAVDGRSSTSSPRATRSSRGSSRSSRTGRGDGPRS